MYYRLAAVVADIHKARFFFVNDSSFCDCFLVSLTHVHTNTQEALPLVGGTMREVGGGGEKMASALCVPTKQDFFFCE
jgi:hypothetical protein